MGNTLILAQISPVLTEVASPTPTIVETLEVVEQVLVTPTPIVQISEGIPFRELIFIAIISLLILIIILQVYLGGSKEDNSD